MTTAFEYHFAISPEFLEDNRVSVAEMSERIRRALLGEAPPRSVRFEPWVDEGDGPVLVEIHERDDTRRYRMHATPAELEGLRALERVTGGAVVVHAP